MARDLVVSEILSEWHACDSKHLNAINRVISDVLSTHRGKVFSYGFRYGGATLVCPTIGGGGVGTISITRAYERKPWIWFETVIDTTYSRRALPRHSYHVVCSKTERLYHLVAWLAADHAVTSLSDSDEALESKCHVSDDERCRIAVTRAAMAATHGPLKERLFLEYDDLNHDIQSFFGSSRLYAKLRVWPHGRAPEATS